MSVRAEYSRSIEPRVAQSTLDQLYLRGVLEWDTYRRKTAALAGFLESDVTDSQQDPFNHQEKLELLGLKQSAPDSIETETHQNS